MAERGARGGVLRRGERWVLELLNRHGRPVADGNGGGPVYEFELGADLAAEIESPRLRIAFRRGEADAEDVELAVPGSWLHDRLLRFAGKHGAAGRFYLPAVHEDRTALCRRRRIEGEPTILDERRYGALVQFTFRLFFYSEPARDEILVALYDAEQDKVLRRGCAASLLERLSVYPDPEFGPGPRVDVNGAFAKAWRHVEERVETEVHRMEEEARPAVERELEVIEAYYRQMIEEEKKSLRTRLSPRAREEGERRLDLLKLEWERRVKEETERLRPQVVASLRAVAVLFPPVERRRLNGTSEAVWLDLARGEAWRARDEKPPPVVEVPG